MKLIELESSNDDGSDSLQVLINPAHIVFIRADKRKSRRKTCYIQMTHYYQYVYGSITMVKKIFEND